MFVMLMCFSILALGMIELSLQRWLWEPTPPLDLKCLKTFHTAYFLMLLKVCYRPDRQESLLIGPVVHGHLVI